MNDITMPIELRLDAARARLIQAKSDFSKSAVAVLKGEPDCAEQATAALLELEQARCELAGLHSLATND